MYLALCAYIFFIINIKSQDLSVLSAYAIDGDPVMIKAATVKAEALIKN